MASHDNLAELQGYRNERSGLRAGAKPGRAEAIDAEIERVEGDLRAEAAGLRRAETELRNIGSDGQADTLAVKALAIESALGTAADQETAVESKPRERAVRKPAGEKA